jgi:hypothetical protein
MQGRIIKQKNKTELGVDPVTTNQPSAIGTFGATKPKTTSLNIQNPTLYSDRIVREVAGFKPPVSYQAGALSTFGYSTSGQVAGGVNTPPTPTPTPPSPPQPPSLTNGMLINTADYLLINSTDKFII